MKTIFEQVRNEIDDFIYNDIEPAPGWDFNQYDTIQRAHLYDNGQFVDNSDYNGREKIFFNISSPRRDAVVRFLDVDTKDFRLHEINPQNEVATMLLQKELELYLQENNFSRTLNDLAHEITTFGSVVLKDTKEGPKVIDIRRLFLDPTVDDIQDSRFVTIKHYFTAPELRKKAETAGWDTEAVERLIRKVEKYKGKSDATDSYEIDSAKENQIRSASYIEVYERYGVMDKSMVDDDVRPGSEDDRDVETLSIVAEPFFQVERPNSDEVDDFGEVLFKSEWTKDEYPFTDFHFKQSKGRWLGVGVMESLFPIQERTNELINQKRIYLELATIMFFQTADPTVLNNVLTDIQNGEVLQVKDQGIVQVNNQARNIPAFQEEQDYYEQAADTISHAGELLRGGQIPASTPATNAVIQNNNSSSIQLWRRENFTIFLREYFKEFVIDDLIKNVSEEHILRFVGSLDELAKLDEIITDAAVVKEAKERALSMEVITPFFIEGVREEVRKKLKKDGNKRYVKVLQDYYKSKIEDGYGIDINLDNEQEASDVIAQNTLQFMQVYKQMDMDNPIDRELTLGWGRKIGMNTGKLELAMNKRDQMQQQAQGADVPQELVRSLREGTPQDNLVENAAE